MTITFNTIPEPDKPKYGRPKGALGKKTLAIQDLMNQSDILEEIASGERSSPILFLMDIMEDENLDLDIRIEAASKTLPYLHRKMPQAIENIMTNADKAFEISFIEKEDLNLQ
jgi:hypothetical protein